MSRISPSPGAAGPAPLPAALLQIAASISRLRADEDQVLVEDTKRILITPTIEALGWDHIYTMACLPDGRTLDQLRDQPEAASTTP